MGKSSTPGTLSRRTLAKGAAWSVPVISIAASAPAVTASQCVVQTNFDGLQVGSRPKTLTFAPSAVVGSLEFASTGNGGDSTPGDTGLVARTTSPPQWNYIEIEQLRSLQAGDTVTVTLKLSAPVENLSFVLHDIDSVDGGYQDTVVVNTPGFTSTLGPGLQGIGTSTNPFKPTRSGDYPINSGLGDLRLRWAGPVQTVSFTYRAGITGSSANQHIGLGNISFSDCVVKPGAVQSRTQVNPGQRVGSASMKSAGDS